MTFDQKILKSCTFVFKLEISQKKRSQQLLLHTFTDFSNDR